MSDKYVLDRNGNPVVCNDLMQWGRWMQTNPDERIIGKNQVGDVLVSTVFLGLDHRFDHGEPLIYETMIFGGEHDGYQERYSTKAEALAGHEVALKLVADRPRR